MINPLTFTGTYKIPITKNNQEDIMQTASVMLSKNNIKATSSIEPAKVAGISTSEGSIWTITVDDKQNHLIDSILKARGIKFAKKDLRELLSPDEIKKRIKIPSDFENEMSLVEVDAKKFNRAYKAHTFDYIDTPYSYGPGGTICNFADYAKTGKPIDASAVYIRDKGRYPQVEFFDGRHRFAYMRKIGMKKIPLAMDEKSKAVCMKYGLI